MVKMLSLCLYNIKKTCQIAVCNNLLWWNDFFTIVDLFTMVKWNQRHHFTIVDRSTMVKKSFHHSRLLHTAIWRVFFFLLLSIKDYCRVWQYRLWSFQTRGTKLEIFLLKNQHTQRKLLSFENWISMGLRSFQKSEF